MYRFAPAIAEVQREIAADVLRLYVERLQPFGHALDDWLGALFSAPLPDDWRQRYYAFLAEQQAKGFFVAAVSVRELEAWIEAWARHCRLLSDERNFASQRRLDAPPNDWPALTEEDRERNRREYGIPWWWPIQPTSPGDATWERRFEELGRTARRSLLRLYRELEATGRAAKDIERAEPPDLGKLEAHKLAVDQALTVYVQDLIAIRKEWTSYQRQALFLGIHVTKLVQRIDAVLPARIEDLRSSANAQLEAATRESNAAGKRATGRVERIHTALVVTDWAITAIEIATVLGVLKGAATRVAAKSMAEGATETAARNAAVKFAVKEILVQGAIAAGGQLIVPPVLEAAGLDEAEVRAGLIALKAQQTLIAVRNLRLKPGKAKPKQKQDEGREPPIGPPPSRKAPDAAPPSPPRSAPIPDRGVWDEGPATRGDIIHERLGQNLPRSFPDVDKLSNGVVTSIKSVDLQAPSYQNPANLRRTVERYIDKVAEFKGGERDKVVITADEIRGRALELAVPPGATAEQLTTLRDLKLYGQAKGVVVTVIEIER